MSSATSRPTVLIPIALGTNRDNDLADAFRLAGAEPVTVPLTALRAGEVAMSDFQILAVPGGFSYGDALGAGRLLGLDLAGWFGDQLNEAAAAGKPIFGVCNGFQALVSAGLLPGASMGSGSKAGTAQAGTAQAVAPMSEAVLTENLSGKFECRWVSLAAPSSKSVWTADLTEDIRCPVAHGEGRFVSADLAALEASEQVALRYVNSDGSEAKGGYPANPNGSAGDVAGVCDESGLVLGLMPHPENHILDWQDPLRGRVTGGICLPLFKSGVAALS